MGRGAGAAQGGAARTPATPTATEVRVASWLVPGAPQVGASLSVVSGKLRNSGTCLRRVKVALRIEGTSAMRVRFSVPREAVLDTRRRLNAVQVRREDAVHGEDPRTEVRQGTERPDLCPVSARGGTEGEAGRSARTHQAQTVAERLRNQGAGA